MSWYIMSIPILAALVLLVSIIAKKMEWFLNYATRLCLGGLALCITSELVMRLSLDCQVGINPATLNTVGLLGIPGFILVVFVSVFTTLKI